MERINDKKGLQYKPLTVKHIGTGDGTEGTLQPTCL